MCRRIELPAASTATADDFAIRACYNADDDLFRNKELIMEQSPRRLIM